MRIPPGFNTVNPYLMVDGAAGFIDFVVAGLGGEETHRKEDGGRIVHAEVRLGTSTLMICDASSSWPPMPGAYYLYVEDADQAMARAVAAGAAVIMAVGDQPYGDRQGGIRDPRGNVWWLSQRLVDGGY